MKYQFKSLNSILGAFEVEVVYRKNAMEYQQQIIQSTDESSQSLKSGSIKNKVETTRIQQYQGPCDLLEFRPIQEIPQNNRNTSGSMGGPDPAMNYQQVFVGNNEINQSPVYPSSYAEGTTRQRRFGSFGEKYV